MKRFLTLLVVLSFFGVLLYPWIARRYPEPIADPDLVAYEFFNPLQLTAAPSEAFRERVFQDPIERVVSRVQWARPEQLYFTQRHPPEDRARLSRRLVEVLEKVRRGSPLAARPIVDLLGVLHEPAVLVPLMRVASVPPDYLQLSAIAALAEFPEDEDLDRLLAELSSGDDESVRRAVQQAVLQRGLRFAESGHQVEVVRALLETTRDGTHAILLMQECERRELRATATAITLHLTGTSLLVRQQALRALLRFEDPRGLSAAVADVSSTDVERILRALEVISDTEAAVDLEHLSPLADHPQSDIRRGLAGALRGTARIDARQREAVIELLHLLAERGNEAISVRRRALRSLHELGESAPLQPLRAKLASAHGEELKDAIAFLCEELKDPTCAAPLRERLQRRSDAQDEAALLFGLRFIGEAADVDLYLRRVLDAGTPADRRSGRVTWLSELAAQYVTTLGPGIVHALYRSLDVARTVRAHLALIDTIRSVAVHSDPAERDRLLGLIIDPDVDLDVRLAAAESVPFFEDPSLGTRVLQMSGEVTDVVLARRLQLVFLNYF